MGDVMADDERQEDAPAEFSPDDVTAQDVVDALRFVLMAQRDAKQIADMVPVLLEFAPDALSDRGLDLIRHMIVEGSLKLALA